jgi:hypothetical protein
MVTMNVIPRNGNSYNVVKYNKERPTVCQASSWELVSDAE